MLGNNDIMSIEEGDLMYERPTDSKIPEVPGLHAKTVPVSGSASLHSK